MATIKAQETLHANHGIIKLDGVAVGRVQGLTVQQDAGSDYVYEVGSFDPIEINHNRGSYRVTVNAFRLRAPAMKTLMNMFPQKLGDIPAFDIEFTDRDNGTEWVAFGVEPTSQSEGIQTNQRVTANIQLMALGVRPGGAGGGSYSGTRSTAEANFSGLPGPGDGMAPGTGGSASGPPATGGGGGGSQTLVP